MTTDGRDVQEVDARQTLLTPDDTALLEEHVEMSSVDKYFQVSMVEWPE